MKLPAAHWQQTWHDEDLAGKFIQDLQKLEQGPLKEFGTSGQWLAQLLAEFGMLAQNMTHLEEDPAHPPQMLQAMERSLKLGALAVHLSGALHAAHAAATSPEGEAESGGLGLGAAVEMATRQAEAKGMPAGSTGSAGSGPAPVPMRRAIQSLADRGVSIGELELITGYPKHVIQAILAET